ncbi:MAG: hypothetical protein JRG95_23220, partial [Deltaproteobacteria bacterium]|nr:hypothetical protein [Deltaproteobacteria bacterium]
MNDPTQRREIPQANDSKRRRESGAAMFIAVLMLVLMGWMGMAAMNTVTRDNQIAGFQNRNQNAFFAAEAGVAYARAVVEHEIGDTTDLPGVGTVPAFPTRAAPTQISQVANYAEWQNGIAGSELPRYYADPNPPDPTKPEPIHYFGAGEIMDGDDIQVGGTHRQGTLWRITVVGQ